MTNTQKERLAKVLARAGVASRREAERLILEGVVSVNNERVNTVTTFVDGSDVIHVNGKKISIDVEPKLWLYHKPKGLITTHKDPQGRPTVFEDIDVGERVISVGRLDLNTEGLLLLTNYGPWARELEMSDLPRVYKVRFFGDVTEKKLDILRRPFVIEGVRYQPFQVERAGDKWLKIIIHEGKNREIRRALEFIGLQVSRLIRVSYGPYELGSLKLHEVLKIK
ncbi:MAG: rRNA pseudouridine synthase [Alphaproteobacteria bacterium]|nr:MAG: rRNA pseudouridine synthase [Alphaproteobacteria bacterium]